ncbi:MAG: hypothetical protein ABSH20_12000 [Tepidisphaeraceae bacterium]|jgi:hypothetical protein
MASPQTITKLIDDLDASAARVRYGAARQLQSLGRQNPALLYPHWDQFVALLDNPRTILRWMAAAILADLVSVDRECKFDRLFRRYFRPIREHVMIAAANIIRYTPTIVAARPDLADKIVREILTVKSARYQTPTCRDIAIGHAIIALGGIHPGRASQAAILRFVQEQVGNDRPATRKKAQALLKRLGKGRLSPPAATKSPPGRNNS